MFAQGSLVTLHGVYNGGLAAAFRVTWYINGVAGSTPNTLIPAVMRASASPIAALNYSNGAASAPYAVGNSGILYEACIYNRAFTADECARDYAGTLYSGVTL
jgi:hypothetical protein